MRTLLLLGVLIAFLSYCASIPEGTLEIRKRVNENSLYRSNKNEGASVQGEPIYIKAFYYPQLLSDGDIRQGGKVLLKLGSKETKYEEIINNANFKE